MGHEQALVFVDFEDRAALAAEVAPVATIIASRFGHPRQPVFGVAPFTGRARARTAGLDADQLAHLERLLALSAALVATVTHCRPRGRSH